MIALAEHTRMLQGRAHEEAWLKDLQWGQVNRDLDRSQAAFKTPSQTPAPQRRSA